MCTRDNNRLSFKMGARARELANLAFVRSHMLPSPPSPPPLPSPPPPKAYRSHFLRAHTFAVANVAACWSCKRSPSHCRRARARALAKELKKTVTNRCGTATSARPRLLTQISLVALIVSALLARAPSRLLSDRRSRFHLRSDRSSATIAAVQVARERNCDFFGCSSKRDANIQFDLSRKMAR